MDNKKILFFWKRAKKMRIGKKSTVLVLILALMAGFSVFQNAQAAALTTLSDTMSNLNDTEMSNHEIKLRTPSGVSGASKTITVDFNTAGFDDGSVAFGDMDFFYGSSQSEVNGSCSSNCTNATLNSTPGAATWGAAFSGNILTLTYPSSGGTAVNANDYIRILIGTNASGGTNRITNPGSTGTKVISIAVDPTGANDTGKLAVVIIADDQVVISTTIDPYISFTLTDNAIALVTTGDGNPAYNATGYSKNDTNTLAVSTNGGSGYSLTYVGSTLTRSGGSETINAIGGTPAASTTNTEQFGMNLMQNATPATGADPTGGSGTATGDYDTADEFAFEAGTTPISLASAGTSSATTTFTASYIVNVTQTTESGAYGTTLTYIATGNF